MIFFPPNTNKQKKRFKMNVDELINKLQNTLNKLINENDLSVKTTNLLNELLETLKIIENCASCKDKKIDRKDLDFDKCLAELEKEEQEEKKEDTINELNKDIKVVLKRIHNNSSDDKIVDILNEVK